MMWYDPDLSTPGYRTGVDPNGQINDPSGYIKCLEILGR
jgi:hypothetical protein